MAGGGGGTSGQMVHDKTVSRAGGRGESQPGGGQPHWQQGRDQKRAHDDADTNTRDHEAGGEIAQLGRDHGLHGGASQHHHHATREPGQDPPGQKPEKAAIDGAKGKAGHGRKHAEPKRPDHAEDPGNHAGAERAYQIAREIGPAKHARRALCKPAILDHRR